MKILIVCPRLCHGGAERVAVTLANGFVEHGYEVVMMSNLFDEISFTVSDKVRLVNLFTSQENKIRKWVGAIGNIRRVLKQFAPDVVIGIMQLCSFVARLAAIGFHIPVIATEHNAYDRPHDVKMAVLEKIVKYHVNKIYDKVTVLTLADYKLIENRMSNVVVMPNPLAFSPAKEVPQHKQKVILAAGRVDDWHCKGYDVLLRAWGRIAQDFQDWTLEIAGVYKDPQTRTYLDSVAKEAGIKDRLHYLGFQDDMQSLFQRSSIFVLSSRYEGFGLVLIEAMSQGCACVACDYNGRQREIITSKNEGVLCLPDSVEDLAQSLRNVLSDDDYRHDIQRGGLKRSEYYSVGHIVSLWDCLFRGFDKK